MDKPNCIIVDIDGTIAKKGDRDIFDYSKCHLDEPIKPVIDFLKMVGESKEQLSTLFVSGREDSCYELTAQWIYENTYYNHIDSGEPDKLYMRKTGDYRDDTIIKKEIYEEHIKDKYNVLFVLDDRPKVIRMWRSLGLFVFNCAQHAEEF